MKNIKKFLLVAVFAIVGASASFAKVDATSVCPAMKDNKVLLNVGIGLDYPWCKLGSASNNSWNWVSADRLLGVSVPVIAEFLLPVKLPFGITANFTPTWGKYRGWDDIKGGSYAILAGANYHISFGPEKLDFYAGLEFGVRINTYKFDYQYYDWNGNRVSETEKGHGANFAWGIHAGVSYYFTKVLGINAAVGYPTPLSVSLALKF